MYQNHSEQAIQQTKPRVNGTYLITMQFISAIITQLIFDSKGIFVLFGFTGLSLQKTLTTITKINILCTDLPHKVIIIF